MRRPSAELTVLLLHGLAGWAWCAAIVGIGRQLVSLDTTLVVHAVAAPMGYALVSYAYFRRSDAVSRLAAAALFVSSAAALDFMIVALLIQKSLVMFVSSIGTWLPLAFILT